ncbi:DUF4012 domain-containing protein [Cryobacterium sp. MDB1-18-2]|uniref:DUF4012 domain-containing protein n=2 Tax=Bacteria TaxID=2 RepID=A0ABY2IJW0_9MICO|nr:DUF4012 domain-containing protein [Cryobacterium sp. MDB2-A-1]TFC09149.1 DUF4012 domain-containing protein [Cryobacterium sp. MDB2-A-2]TFC18045.1 DUF4012 domain-containing protein [Cryobacterium glucosi]TFC22928.1 DUF4012 domain-containing protein [Cryobacterium sp. MDB2-10]TFC34179.1 DUF4012 domain-containing protein [Cryobacterium sp. MDB1-18-2]TFC46456.1 DUF4012 domain-containing protein [Cryobacterium sp. MDB1-18-1]
MSHAHASAPVQGRRRRGRRIWLSVGIPLVLLVGIVAWVGVRAYLAKGELEAALPLAAQIQAQVVAGDGESAQPTARALSDHSASAAALTSDPVWRAFEGIPVLGPNLTVVRQLAAATDDIAQQAVLPLTKIAGTISLSDFKPVNGAINLKPMTDAQPQIDAADAALAAVKQRVDAIDTTDTLSVVTSAAEKLSTSVDKAADAVNTLDRAVRVVPGMLGASGPRNYIVLFQNPAELRASGGIPGALALIHTEDGAITLAQQTAGTDFPHYAQPVLPLPTETRGLYGDIVGEYIQDVTLTPNFPLSASLAREMWKRQFGVEADGVISIDPVALSYLLKATGPITLATGDVLTSDNAVHLLLSDAYARYTKPADQNAFFAGAASSVFSALASGGANPKSLLEALGQAGAERRVLVWSAHDDDQAVLQDTSLAGRLPVTDADTTRFGVYLNDATGAKMDTHLDVQVAVGNAVCRQDARPYYAVTVNLKNTAPADAAKSLPEYVTGGGHFGVTPGNVKTIVSVYGAPDMQNLGVMRDNVVIGYHPATDATYPVSASSIELAPGESAVLTFGWLGAGPLTSDVSAQITPGTSRVVATNASSRCDSLLWPQR